MRDENDQYVKGLWWRAGTALVVAVVAFLVMALVAHETLFPILGAVLGVSLVLGVRWWAQRGIDRAFLERGPERLIQRFSPRVTTRTLPNAEAWSAYFEAWALTLYGRFDAARAALARVDFKREPALVRAAATSVEALLCYFDERDFAQGFNLARVARAGADVSEEWPGAKTSLLSHDCIVEIGRVVSVGPRADSLSILLRGAALSAVGSRLIAQWGLAVAYTAKGDAAEAARALAYCRKHAPYCAPLNEVPELNAA